MALSKRVKIGGAYYKGFELIVSSTAGDYVLSMSVTSGATVNSFSAVPDAYGAGDRFKLEHIATDSTTVLAILAEDIYNPGANVATLFDFPALEHMEPNEILKLTYTNTAGNAVNVHTIVEYVGIRRLE